MRFFKILGAFAVLAACSETPLKPQVSTVTETSSNIEFEVVTAFQAKNAGPALAKGVIYYFGGHSDEGPTPEDDNIVQPYLISLNKRGWDVYRANPPIPFRQNRYRQALADSMNVISKNARSNGYKKVVLTGQSFGSWNILLASDEAEFDKFVSIAPACCGLAEKYSGPAWEENMKRIVGHTKESVVPGIIFTFKEDEFYTENVTNAVAAQTYPNVTVVDRPAGFVGHGSAWLQAFDFVYTDCFDKYLSSNASSFSCKTPPIKNLIRNEQDLQNNGYVRVNETTFTSNFVGNTLAGNAFGDTLNMFFPANDSVITEARSGYNKGRSEKSSYSFKGTAICTRSKLLGDGCVALYKRPQSDVYYATDEEGNILFQGEIVAGNPRKLG
ncbi:hypothetical protein ROLI_010700 [Roseobacter fucihabitans]|uniref:Alpha/beta hydrolase n=1 Tax=Roseobacter fucihabitans TaxID=1537242 RepID=A0ABZ2BRB7_9RHOB|nr:hypothetical protein [Roseobacter litoralis]MBC6965530.1 hypothetical protein [Roseobacter litoralis]